MVNIYFILSFTSSTNYSSVPNCFLAGRLALDRAFSNCVGVLPILLTLNYAFCNCFGSSGLDLSSISYLISCEESVRFCGGYGKPSTFKSCINAFSSKKRDPSTEICFVEDCLLRFNSGLANAYSMERSIAFFLAGKSEKLSISTF
jgi:hypothetical protein